MSNTYSIDGSRALFIGWGFLIGILLPSLRTWPLKRNAKGPGDDDDGDVKGEPVTLLHVIVGMLMIWCGMVILMREMLTATAFTKGQANSGPSWLYSMLDKHHLAFLLLLDDPVRYGVFQIGCGLLALDMQGGGFWIGFLAVARGVIYLCVVRLGDEDFFTDAIEELGLESATAAIGRFVHSVAAIGPPMNRNKAEGKKNLFDDNQDDHDSFSELRSRAKPRAQPNSTPAMRGQSDEAISYDSDVNNGTTDLAKGSHDPPKKPPKPNF